MKETAPRPAVETKLEASQLHVWFGERHALRGVALSVIAKKTVAVIGASGSGKSTLLRAFNRLHVLVPNARLQGSVKIDGAEILGAGVDTGALRRRVGMVFTVPAMLPGSILDNVAFGLQAKGMRDRAAIEKKVESAVRRVYGKQSAHASTKRRAIFRPSSASCSAWPGRWSSIPTYCSSTIRPPPSIPSVRSHSKK
jgi:ABC-type phosphate transport system ATPase subunit